MSIVPLLSSQAGGAFGDTPLLIPNLGLWLKADAGITLVSGAVDAWADQSGNGRDYSALAAGNRPAFSGTLNGLPVLTFDGTTDYLIGNVASRSIAQNVTGITMIVVAKYGGLVIERAIGISDEGISPRCILGASTTQWQTGGQRLNAESPVVVGGGTSNTNYVIQSGILRYSVATAAVFVNSVSQVDTAFQTAGSTENLASANTYIGCAANVSAFINGNIAEVIIYQRAISVAERNSVERYLSVKWGIAI